MTDGPSSSKATPRGSDPTLPIIEIQRRLGVELSEVDSLDVGLRACLRAAMQASDTDAGGIYLCDAERRELTLAAHRGLPPEFVDSVHYYGPGSQQAQIVFAGKPVYIPFSSVLGPEPDVREREGLRVMGVVPVLSGGNVIACLNVASRVSDTIPVEARVGIEAIAAQVGNAIVRLRLAERLASSEERYRMLFNGATDAVLIHEFEPDGRPGPILAANSAACEALQRSEKQLSHTELFSLASTTDGKALKDRALELVETGRSSFEAKVPRPDGSHVHLDVKAQLATIRGKLIAMSIMRDVTQRLHDEESLRRSGAELRALAQRLADASETERRRVATELHDGIAQTVTGLRYSLGALLKGLPDGTPVAQTERVRTALEDLGAVSAQVRDVISELRPPLLEDEGLAPALAALAESLSLRYGTDIRVRETGETAELDERMSLALFRIAQEAMNNACRHADAQLITVVIVRDEGELRVTVEDNGKGFSPEGNGPTAGGYRLGLATMRERAAAVNAKLSVESDNKQGTRVCAMLTLESAD